MKPCLHIPITKSFKVGHILVVLLLINVLVGVETFHKILDDGQAGDQVGALVRGMKKDDVKRGMVLSAPGTVTSHSKLLSQV